MRIITFTIVFLVTGCSAPQMMVESSELVRSVLPGVDSTQIETAWRLAEESFARDAEEAVRAAATGRELAALADSFLKPVQVSSVRDTVKSLASFNAGADMLGQVSEADSLHALEYLESAAVSFEEALEADAFDDDARQWLAHVYRTLAERFQRSGAMEERLRVLQHLVTLNQDRHDYIALLAAAQEGLQTKASRMAAGALWERAALIALDDVDMGLRQFPDSTALFAYHVRASRAFALAGRGLLARESLHSARIWERTEEERALIDADSLWLAWDDGNLSARKRFDALLTEASTNPENATGGLLLLLEDVRSSEARIEVRHQLALARYASGADRHAIELMHALVMEVPHQKKLVEDYAVMAYNLAQVLRGEGDLRGALAYLLQCAALDAQIAARAAFDAALLLRNNLDESIKYAHMAEANLDTLDRSERSILTQYLAELYRRSGDRERAREYIERLTDLQKN